MQPLYMSQGSVSILFYNYFNHAAELAEYPTARDAGAYDDPAPFFQISYALLQRLLFGIMKLLISLELFLEFVNALDDAGFCG